MTTTDKTAAGARMPAIFVAHGAPMLLDDQAWVQELAAFGLALPRPKAILMLSAHWEARPLALGATRRVPLIYDFSGFPRRFYELAYASPGAPELAARVRELLARSGAPFVDAPDRGLDHGAYVPLMCMYPDADIPVLQLSLPGLEPRAHLELGKALAPLRDEGVLIVGSGFLTHNMRALGNSETPAWASEFDAWSADVLERRDTDALLDYRARAPGVRMALPTHEHFVPVISVMGAGAAAETVTFPTSGFAWGSFTKRSVQIG